jgi:hypothetical protein
MVIGVDLELRTKVAAERGWLPVTELIRENHNADEHRALICPV